MNILLIISAVVLIGALTLERFSLKKRVASRESILELQTKRLSEMAQERVGKVLISEKLVKDAVSDGVLNKKNQIAMSKEAHIRIEKFVGQKNAKK